MFLGFFWPCVFETEIYFTDSWRATRARRRFSFVGRSRGGPFICLWRGGGSRMGPLDGVFESRRWVADLFRVARRWVAVWRSGCEACHLAWAQPLAASPHLFRRVPPARSPFLPRTLALR